MNLVLVTIFCVFFTEGQLPQPLFQDSFIPVGGPEFGPEAESPLNGGTKMLQFVYTCMSLDSERKSEYSEKTHGDMNSA